MRVQSYYIFLTCASVWVFFVHFFGVFREKSVFFEQNTQKKALFCIFYLKNLVMSKKSINFAPAFCASSTKRQYSKR